MGLLSSLPAIVDSLSKAPDDILHKQDQDACGMDLTM